MRQSEMQSIADTPEEFYLGKLGKTLEQCADAKQAGATFYSADENQRPYVIHVLPGRGARIMASTSIHGQRKDETNIFVKSLPGVSHSADADFIAGYSEAESQAKALMLPPE